MVYFQWVLCKILRRQNFPNNYNILRGSFHKSSRSNPLRPCGFGQRPRLRPPASCATADGPQASGGRGGGCPRSLRTTPNGTPASRAGGSLSCASRWSSGIPCGFCVTGHQGLPFRFKRKSWNPRNGFPDGLPVFEFSDWDLNSNSKNSKPELPGGKPVLPSGKPVILTRKCRKIWKNSGKSPSHMKKLENLAEFPLIMCILTVYNV